MKRNRIGIDLMGSDHAPASLLVAVAVIAPSLPANIELAVIGTPDLERAAKSRDLTFIPVQEVIGMEENPLFALRRKKRSSICVGLRLLKEKKLDAFVSAGNTGALVTASKMIVGIFPGIQRPALLALMPTKKKPVAVLDVGANLQAKASQLIQFARLGAAYQMARGIETPRIGILNIGSEASKGTSEIRQAYKQLEKSPSFAGNIEGKSVFDGDVDVLITDGFTGNVFLKTAEGIASLILDRLQARFPCQEDLKKIQVHLDDLQRHLHYAKHPGALLCGVKGTVVKCHGYSTEEAFINAVRGAIEFTTAHFVEVVQKQMSKALPFANP